MPVLRAASLDIGWVKTHTLFMLSCRKGALMRLLPLLGLVLAVVVFGVAEARAEANASVGDYVRATDTSDYSFPYLAPEKDQREILLNAFSFQMKIFSGINGAVGGNSVDALRYLAVTAFLIGALMLIFNAKLRKGPIVASWLLVALITMFAPYGSKMLFYPLSTKGLIFDNKTETVSNCADNSRLCGFAPQLAAVHVASVLQVLFSDLFKSSQWQGLIESSNSEKDLATEKKFESQKWRDAKNDLKMCSGKYGWQEAMTYRGDSESNDTNDAYIPRVLGEEWKDLISKYKDLRSVGGNVNTVTPYAYVLYDEASIPSQWQNDRSLLQNYVQGLTVLYRAVTEDIKTVDLSSNRAAAPAGGANTYISVDEALAKMDEKGFFKASYSCNGMFFNKICSFSPGYFFVWENASNVQAEETAAHFRRCWGAPNLSQQVAGGGNISPELTNNADYMTYCADNTKPYNEVVQAIALKDMVGEDQSFATGTFWNNLLQGENKFLQPALGNMPVGVITYVPASQTAALPVETSAPGRSCKAAWKSAIDNAINETLGNPQRGTVQLTPLKELLLNGTTLTLVDSEDGKSKRLPKIYDSTKVELGCNGNGDYTLKENLDYCSNGKIALNIATTYARKYRDKLENMDAGATLTPTQAYELLLRQIVSSIDQSTDALGQNEAEKTAEDGTREIAIKGNSTLTAVAGFGAKFFGTVLVKIASWFTGPVAAAYVYFLSILVNMALIALIVLTPILFLFGLAMPGAAIGLITVSVLGVFVLKFVPVTLLILNNIGGMVYDMIAAGGGEKAGTMQDLMIIAMAGLYTNIVGMTFFLLFKMGDASAMLSRFTALDGNAKQIAERAVTATYGIATALVAAPLASGVLAALGGAGLKGSALAAAGVAKKNALDAIPAGAQKALSDAQEQARKGVAEEKTGDKTGAGVGDLNPDGTPKVPGSEASETAGTGFDGFGDSKFATSMGALDKRLKAQYDGDEAAPLSEEERETLWNGGTIQRGNELISYNKDTGFTSATPVGMESQASSLPSNVTAVPGATADVVPTEGGAVPSATPVAANAVAGAADTAAGGIPPSVRIAGGNLDTVGEVTSARTMALSESQADMVQRKEMESKATKQAKENEAMGSYIEEAHKRGELTGTNYDAAKARLAEMRSTTDDFERERAQRDLQRFVIDAGGKSKAEVERDAFKMRNLNDQIAVELDKIEPAMDVIRAKERAEGSDALTNEEKDLVKYYNDLRKVDTTAASIGQVTKQLEGLQNLNASMDARAGADLIPGIGKNFLSGVYGSFAGSGGGLSKIPVIGPALSESLNEYYQAPERARAWNSAGGFAKWWGAQGDAKRMGFYQKEMGPIGAATQYQAMSTLGGFEAQAAIAREAANQAVARSRSQWEAMVAHSNPNLKMDIANEIRREHEAKNPGAPLDVKDLDRELSMRFSSAVQKMHANGEIELSAVQLKGIGMMDANFKVGQLRAEAKVIGEAMMPYVEAKGAYTDGDGAIQLRTVTGKDGQQRLDISTQERRAVLTPDLLAKLGADAGIKGVAGQLDTMMTNAYGIFEKQFQRSTGDWDATRAMHLTGKLGASAAAKFIAEDMSTDYLVGGHLKMVEGKERFMGMKGQYETLLNFRNDTNKMVAGRIQQLMNEVGNNINDAIAKADIPIDKIKAPAGTVDYQIALRGQFDKWATNELRASGAPIPLTQLFDVATMKGSSSYELKARKAIADMSAEEARIEEEIAKARETAMKRNLSNMSSTAFKNMRTEVKGNIAEATAPIQVWNEMISEAFGKGADSVNTRLTNILKKTPDFEKTVFQAFKDISDDPNAPRKIGSFMNKNVWAELRSTMSADEIKRLDAMKERFFREEADRIILSYAEIDKYGKIDKEFNTN